MRHTEFDVFKDYVGLKVHFNEWDFIWNPDKNYNISTEALRKRKDKPFFTRLVAIKTKRVEWVEYLISAFMKNRHTWVGDIFDEDTEESHRVRMSHRRALEYNFKVDCENIREHLSANAMTLPQLLRIGNSQPRIFETRVDGGVTEETLGVLDHFFHFTRQGTNNMLWEESRLKICKYKHTLGLHEYAVKLKPHIDTLLLHK